MIPLICNYLDESCKGGITPECETIYERRVVLYLILTQNERMICFHIQLKD